MDATDADAGVVPSDIDSITWGRAVYSASWIASLYVRTKQVPKKGAAWNRIVFVSF
jgi:hypothetical protein